jgi:predicted DNA-binding transcriptional regulator AlpA
VSSPQDLDAGPQPASPPRLAGDRLITIAGIRAIFGLGRTAAYDLTHRPDFPAHVPVSPRCYRWWASEVNAFAEALRRERARPAPRPAVKPRLPDPAMPPGRITGNVRAARTSRKEPP